MRISRFIMWSEVEGGSFLLLPLIYKNGKKIIVSFNNYINIFTGFFHNFLCKIPEYRIFREQFSKSIIGILATLISLEFLYKMITDYGGMGIRYRSSFPYFISLGFPFLLFLSSKIVRNCSIAICLITLCLRRGWIGITCVGITSIIFLWESKKILAIFLIIFSLISSMVFSKYYSRESFLSDIKKRIIIYEIALNNWKNIWWGQGVDTFKNLPENQPDKRADKRWLTRVHSDLIEGFYELGIIKMIPMLFFILLPLSFKRTDKPVFASYLCVLLQSIVDFPFHRWTTGLLSLTIILMMYYQGLNEKVF